MKGREKFLERAIDCFRRQTYRNTELLIVPDSFFDVDGIIPENCSRFDVVIPSGPKLKIGPKRNVGCQWARGEYIAIWDDDDYSAPCRIEKQVERLQQRNSGLSVTANNVMFFTDGAAWWKFDYPDGFGAGTSLAFRRHWWKDHQFDEGEYAMIGEDCRFITEAHEARVFAPTVHLDMYATIHPGNTSKKQPLEPGWKPLPGYVWRD